jgi:endonuclease/exonuclease/phosphatase family metal-dependent hydrolase
MSENGHIRIVCYNILNGGMGRLDPIYETLLYLDPQVIGLCEATDPAAVAYLADKLGMDHVVAESNGDGNHVALLTARPILKMINVGATIDGLSRAAMIVDLQQSNGQTLRCVLAHLPAGYGPQNEATRLAELKQILGTIPDDQTPTCLMGDFNASAPYHTFDANGASPEMRDQINAHTPGITHDVVNWLTEQGWTDTLADSPEHTYTTGFPATRTDYIWLDSSLGSSVHEAGVETGGFTPYCSDHYPVWATLT